MYLSSVFFVFFRRGNLFGKGREAALQNEAPPPGFSYFAWMLMNSGLSLEYMIFWLE